uniref:Uncharacterized protein n=1 Tax=Anguilla anguilla TaxID=7936 RepID=A0A0E9UI63_ANGAN
MKCHLIEGGRALLREAEPYLHYVPCV